MFFLSINKYFIFLISEREKNPLITILCTADHGAAVHGHPGVKTVDTDALLLGEASTERSYEPFVGRWGCEWPSWLENVYQSTTERPLLGGTGPVGPSDAKNHSVNHYHHNNNNISSYTGHNGNLFHLLEETQVRNNNNNGKTSNCLASEIDLRFWKFVRLTGVFRIVYYTKLWSIWDFFVLQDP